MKSKTTNITATFAAVVLGSAALHAQVVDDLRKRADTPAEAKAEIKIDGGDARAEARDHTPDMPAGNGATTRSVSKSVSVTSDGNRTVRRTVTTRDGVTEEKTEVLDENGDTRDGGQPAGENRSPRGTGGIGLDVKEADPATRDQLDLRPGEGVVVVGIDERGPAARAGLQKNDILIRTNDQVLAKEEDLRSELRNLEVGDTMDFEYLRKGQRGSATVTVGACRDENDRHAGDDGNDRNRAAIEININGNPALDQFLNDPNIPEAMRRQIREMLCEDRPPAR